MNISPTDLLFKGLSVGMQICGDLYEQNERFVVDMLKAAKTMEQALPLLLPRIQAQTQQSVDSVQPKIIIGLVRGNTQDIGKNLVRLMLIANGFELIDLGKNVTPETFFETAKTHKANVIAMAVMTDSSTVYVKRLVQLLHDEGLFENYLVLCGGGAVSVPFAKRLGILSGAHANQGVKYIKHFTKYGTIPEMTVNEATMAKLNSCRSATEENDNCELVMKGSS